MPVHGLKFGYEGVGRATSFSVVPYQKKRQLADLDLEPINLADQLVLTYLGGDIFPRYAGGLPPRTADLGLGFRLGFLQLQHPNLRTSRKNRHVQDSSRDLAIGLL